MKSRIVLCIPTKRFHSNEEAKISSSFCLSFVQLSSGSLSLAQSFTPMHICHGTQCACSFGILIHPQTHTRFVVVLSKIRRDDTQTIRAIRWMVEIWAEKGKSGFPMHMHTPQSRHAHTHSLSYNRALSNIGVKENWNHMYTAVWCTTNQNSYYIRMCECEYGNMEIRMWTHCGCAVWSRIRNAFSDNEVIPIWTMFSYK